MASGQTQDKTTEMAQQAKEKGRQVVEQTQRQGQEKARAVKGQASDRLREQVDRRSTQTGEQMQTVGGALRRTADDLRGEGNDLPAKATQQAAEKMEQLGGYLKDSNADDILRDLEDFARRRPWIVGGAGALAGFLGSRFLKASSSKRYEARQQFEVVGSADELAYPPLPPPSAELESPLAAPAETAGADRPDTGGL